MSDQTCPNCGAPKMGEWAYACHSDLGDEACRYAASLRTERDKYKAALERIASDRYSHGDAVLEAGKALEADNE